MSKRRHVFNFFVIVTLIGIVYLVSIYGRSLRLFVEKEFISQGVLGLKAGKTNKDVILPSLKTRLQNDINKQIKTLETVILNISVADVVSTVEKSQKIGHDVLSIKDLVKAKIKEFLQRY